MLGFRRAHKLGHTPMLARKPIRWAVATLLRCNSKKTMRQLFLTYGELLA